MSTTMSQHKVICDSIVRTAHMLDRRITRLPTAIRIMRKKNKLAQIVEEVSREKRSGLDFRPDCGSGRSSHWSRWSFDIYATAVTDLIRRGYDRGTAKKIADAVRACICVDNRIYFDFDATPPTDCPHRNTYGWAETERAQQWSNWRHWIESQPSPRFGRRTRQFRSAADRIVAAKRKSDLAARLAARSPAAVAIADRIRAYMPGIEGVDWCVTESSLAVRHGSPDGWRDAIVAAGVRVGVSGSCLRLWDTVYPITVTGASVAG